MPDTEFWNKEFVITSVTRADLQEHGFPDEKIAQLSDEDMETIAAAMEDIYCDSGYCITTAAMPHMVKASASHSCKTIRRLSAVTGSKPARIWRVEPRAPPPTPRRRPRQRRRGSQPCP